MGDAWSSRFSVPEPPCWLNSEPEPLSQPRVVRFRTFLVMFDELAEYCEEMLELKKRMNRLDRRSEEFYELMSRLDALFMAMRFTAKHLGEESERMDTMSQED